MASVAGAVPSGVAAPGRGSAHSAAASYSNASIATTALKYVGRWGGYACADAHRSGETASSTVYPDYPSGTSAADPPKPGVRINPDDGGDGQCRSFVNCIVWMASGGTQWLGFDPGDYFYAFTHPEGGGAPGVEITSVAQLTEGDIVQIGNGTHTFIILAPAPTATDTATTKTFTVVDSNYDLDEYVHEHTLAVTLSDTERAFRLGSATAVSQPHSPMRPSLQTLESLDLCHVIPIEAVMKAVLASSAPSCAESHPEGFTKAVWGDPGASHAAYVAISPDVIDGRSYACHAKPISTAILHESLTTVAGYRAIVTRESSPDNGGAVFLCYEPGVFLLVSNDFRVSGGPPYGFPLVVPFCTAVLNALSRVG